jgi:hypothetical protein
MESKTAARIVAALGVALVLASPRPARAQTMSFSIYNDASASSAGTITSWSTVVDNSSCYSHSNYMTRLTIWSPTGRSSTQQSSGLYSSTQISIGSDFGEYTMATQGMQRHERWVR